MKTLRILTSAVFLSFLMVAVVGAAHTGVVGRLWDSAGPPSDPWVHGAKVVAVECDAAGAIGDQVYGCDNANTAGPITQYGRFDFAWGTNNCTGVTLNDTTPDGPNPADDGWVCLFINWDDGGSGQPGDMVTAPQQYLTFLTARMSFDNIQSLTGPTAITLANVTAQSANFWLPVGLAALSFVAVGALIITRRRRS
jgi:hypothetical protein